MASNTVTVVLLQASNLVEGITVAGGELTECGTV